MSNFEGVIVLGIVAILMAALAWIIRQAGKHDNP